MNPTLTAEMLGLPQGLFDAVKNLVSTTMHTGGFNLETRKVRKSDAEIKALNDQYKIDLRKARANKTALPTIPSFYEFKHFFTRVSTDVEHGVLMLNHIHDLIFEFGYEYSGVINGKHTFYKFFPVFEAGDKKVYLDFDSYFYLYQRADGKWIFTSENEMDKIVYLVPDEAATYKLPSGQLHTPFKQQQFTYEQIAESMQKTVEYVKEWDFDYILCEERNPKTHLTSIFPRWSDDGSEFATYINGIRHDLAPAVNTLVNEANQKYSDYDINMAALNVCEVPADHKDAESMGNFGECKDQWFENEEEAKVFTFNYDLDREVAVKSFAVEWARPGTGMTNGHYNRVHAYYDLKGGRVVQSSGHLNSLNEQ